MDDLYLGPFLMLNETIELTATVRADSHDEGASADFFRKTNELGLLEFLGSVDSETPRRPTEHVDQHRHLCRIGSKVRMHMPDIGRAQPELDMTSLKQINKVNR